MIWDHDCPSWVFLVCFYFFYFFIFCCSCKMFTLGFIHVLIVSSSGEPVQCEAGGLVPRRRDSGHRGGAGRVSFQALQRGANPEHGPCGPRDRQG